MKTKTFTLEEIEVAVENMTGFCIACGEESDGCVEPDARNHHCDCCGEDKVFGAEEIALMGLVR